MTPCLSGLTFDLMNRTVLLIISIDTECDKGPNWQTQHPLRFDSVRRGIPERLMPLFDSFGVKPTFLLSPEVMRDDASCKTLSEIQNCELGTHLHGEFIEPQADWDNAVTSTPQLFYSPQVERQKLENLTRLFEQKFSRPPRSFRAGRFGLGPRTLGFLQDLGYRVDSSVTPFWCHDFGGGHVNHFWGASLHPYFPSRRDARRVGNLKILEVPVTIVNPFFLKWPRWILRRLHERSVLLKKILPRLGFQIPKTMWLRPARSSGAEMIRVAQTVIEQASTRKPIVLNMMYHSVEVIPAASPYAATESDVEKILQSQREFFAWLFANHSVRSIGLSETPADIRDRLK